MKKILLTLASVLFVNLSVICQEPSKQGSTGFDIPRDRMLYFMTNH